MTLAELKQAVQDYYAGERNNEKALEGLEEVASDIDLLMDCIRDDMRG